jgi:cell division protein FtsI (penicillin-binding protein 3)
MTSAGQQPRIESHGARKLRSSAVRAMIVGAVVFFGFAAISVQLVRLAAMRDDDVRLAVAAPLTTAFSRPDIVDRSGRLLATDVATPSLFADPSIVPDVDETMEALREYLPTIDTPDLRRNLADRSRRFLWIARNISTAQASELHNLGIPGLSFRNEPARIYPGGRLAGHVLGYVDVDNQGIAGIERYINENVGVIRLPVARTNTKPPLRLSIDAAAQHGLEQELSAALDRYRAVAGTAIVMDAASGEIAAAASLPPVDPAVPQEVLADARKNRLTGDAFELGSVFKLMTVAMALESGIASPDTIVDVTEPLRIGRYRITDFHPSGRPLTLSEVFVKSSNIGSARLALAMGEKLQREYLERLGLTRPLETELGHGVTPILPQHWGKAATATISYGHGIAVSPLHFAAAAAALVNGGTWVTPTFLARATDTAERLDWRRQVVSPATSARLREMMRRTVQSGSGRRADVPGYEVGGKTGTADWASERGYDGKAVINSFLAAFPINEPRYVVFVTLFDPKPESGRKERTAGLNAAVAAGEIIARVAPLLGVRPKHE